MVRSVVRVLFVFALLCAADTNAQTFGAQTMASWGEVDSIQEEAQVGDHVWEDNQTCWDRVQPGCGYAQDGFDGYLGGVVSVNNCFATGPNELTCIRPWQNDRCTLKGQGGYFFLTCCSELQASPSSGGCTFERLQNTCGWTQHRTQTIYDKNGFKEGSIDCSEPPDILN